MRRREFVRRRWVMLLLGFVAMTPAFAANILADQIKMPGTQLASGIVPVGDPRATPPARIHQNACRTYEGI